MSDGTLITGGRLPSVRLERRLADPPEVVWRALTDREALKAWFPCDVEVHGGRWVVGAAITFRFPPEVIDMTLEGEVLHADRPRALAYRWGDEVLRYELSADGDGTVLVLVNELPGDRAARNAAGWEQCLDRLAGRTPDPSDWRGRFDRYEAAFTPVIGHQEGPPAGYKGDSG